MHVFEPWSHVLLGAQSEEVSQVVAQVPVTSRQRNGAHGLLVPSFDTEVVPSPLHVAPTSTHVPALQV
jgi:hypothetical protein